jgi:hypothetical protein
MVPATPPDDGKTTDDLIQQLGREIKEQAPVSTPLPPMSRDQQGASVLKEPVPALRMMCRIGETMQTFCAQGSRSCISKCAPKPECTVDADCRLFDDYCTGCDCRALASSTAAPACAGPGVRCLREPCGGHTAKCDAGKCAVN